MLGPLGRVYDRSAGALEPQGLSKSACNRAERGARAVALGPNRLRLAATMKAYLIITCIIFALILVAHAARVVSEGVWLLTEPTFIGTSIAALGLSAWAVVLLRRK